MRTTMIAIGQARRSSARACTPKSVGSMAQSTSNMSNPAVGACANVVDQSAVSPTISIFRSRNITRRALRSSGWASARNTRVMNSYCTKHSPATSNWWGVFASATWGRDSRGSVDQSLAQRQGDGFRAAGNTQLGKDVADMGLDGGGADGQPRGDLRVVQPLDHQGQHYALALRQVEAGLRRLAGGMDQRLGSLGREGGPAGMRGANGLGQLVGRHVLEQITDGSGLERALDQDLFREARQRNHLDRFGLVADEARRGGPIHVRHDHIHQNYIRLELDTELNGCLPTGGFPRQFQVIEDLEEGRQPTADHRMIVNDQDADTWGGGRHRASCSGIACQRTVISVPCPGQLMTVSCAPTVSARSRIMSSP